MTDRWPRRRVTSVPTVTPDGDTRPDETGAAGRPSHFWAHLGSEHQRALDAFGPDGVKRQQALRYFTWRWGFSSILRSEQFRFLLTHTSPFHWVRAAREPVDLSDEAWHRIGWSRRDRWLYSFATRLVWDFALMKDCLRVLDQIEPAIGDPLPVRHRGRLISQDLANSALEVGSIGSALGGREPQSILEVGAGYGRTAYALLSVYPNATYTIVDIEPALSISQWYLSQLFASERLRFLRPDQLAPDCGEIFDLGVSISSLAEMTGEQLQHYILLFDRAVAGGTVYLKQWKSWRNPTDGITLAFDEYPIPPNWGLLFKSTAPVQTSFAQGAWAVPRQREGNE